MLRTGNDYIESIRDGRQVWIDGERVKDVATHPAFKPIVDIRARIYDMGHDPDTKDVMTYTDAETGQTCSIGAKPPMEKTDWYDKKQAVETVLDDVGGVVTRVGDETVGEMWSLFDGQEVLNRIDPQFSENITRHVRTATLEDPFHVSANTDAKGDRARWPQDQDPDVLLRVVRETDNGIIVRGAKFETAAAYANQAFVKPTIADWGNAPESEYAVGFIAPMGAPGMKHICRSGFAGTHPVEDYPLTNRFDEIDTMLVFDDVEIPWEDVLFYRHTEAAAFIRSTLHRYSVFPFLQRHLRYSEYLLGAAYLSIQQTGVKMHQGVREKIARLAAYREMINAHLIAAIETSSRSPEGMLMPNPQIMYGARMQAAEQLPEMMHLVRDLSGCQISLVPSASSFEDPEIAGILNKYFTVGNDDGHERRKMLTFARDLLNSHYAGHRLTFQLFAQSPPFSHQLAMYNNYDFSAVSDLVQQAANLGTDFDVDHAKKADLIEEAGDFAMRPHVAQEANRRANNPDPLHEATELAEQAARR